MKWSGSPLVLLSIESAALFVSIPVSVPVGSSICSISILFPLPLKLAAIWPSALPRRLTRMP